MKLKFISLGSGSSGNCYYIGTTTYGILIDAGIATRTIRKALRERGIAMENIIGVFVTHDHADHIRAAGNISNEFNIPVYTTEAVHQGMYRNYCMTKKIPMPNRRYLNKGETFRLKDFEILPFEVPHDSTDNIGYSISIKGVNFCFITDIGSVTPEVLLHTEKVHYLIIEANYDEEMLANGPYPAVLKKRISNGTGHLSNRETGEFLKNHYPSNIRHIWLCHLSKENNRPELAYGTVCAALRSIGKEPGRDVGLMPLPRTSPTPIFEIDEMGYMHNGCLFDCV